MSELLVIRKDWNFISSEQGNSQVLVDDAGIHLIGMSWLLVDCEQWDFIIIIGIENFS